MHRPKKEIEKDVWVLINANPVIVNDEIVQVIVTFIDISERTQAEEERLRLQERLSRAEKMESLGILADGVAHDLNNILGIVLGYAELLLLKENRMSAIRTELEAIMKGGQKAAAVVDDLLTLARRGVPGRRCSES